MAAGAFFVVLTAKNWFDGFENKPWNQADFPAQLKGAVHHVIHPPERDRSAVSGNGA